MDDRKLDITLLCGGISAQRESLCCRPARRSPGHCRPLAIAVLAVGCRAQRSPGHWTAGRATWYFPRCMVSSAKMDRFSPSSSSAASPSSAPAKPPSRLGMDKAATKSCLLEHDVPTPSTGRSTSAQIQGQLDARLGHRLTWRNQTAQRRIFRRLPRMRQRTSMQARTHLQETLPQIRRDAGGAIHQWI